MLEGLPGPAIRARRPTSTTYFSSQLTGVNLRFTAVFTIRRKYWRYDNDHDATISRLLWQRCLPQNRHIAVTDGERGAGSLAPAFPQYESRVISGDMGSAFYAKCTLQHAERRPHQHQIEGGAVYRIHPYRRRQRWRVP